MVATAQRTTLEVSTIGRGIVIGALLGWIAVTALATLLGLASGMGLTSAFGFAACVSVWGGLGFGAMMGGTVAFTHDLERQQHSCARLSRRLATLRSSPRAPSPPRRR